jgi:riboflavin synthase
VEPPPELLRYLAFKGAIAIDGVSLTVAQVEGRAFTAAIIPYTFDHTALGAKRRGDAVNLEVDLLARYVERLLREGGGPAGGSGLTLEKLRAMGY